MDSLTQDTIPVYDLNSDTGYMAADAVDHADGEVLVTLADSRRLRIPRSLLQERAEGGYALPVRFDSLAAAGAAAVVEVIPVVAEEAHVRTQRVETGRVRIEKSVESSEQLVDVPLLHDNVHIERVPIGRWLDDPERESPPAPRQDGDTLIIPVLEEVLVVQKRLMLREEVRITTVRHQTQHQETVTLRREWVNITRTGPEDGPET